MSSIQNRIRIERLVSSRSHIISPWDFCFSKFFLYPGNKTRGERRFSLKEISDKELLRCFYLPWFFNSYWFDNMDKNEKRFVSVRDAASAIDTENEENFLLQLYRVYVVILILKHKSAKDTYDMFDDKTIDELEELYDSIEIANKEAKESSKSPFWKFW